MWDILRKDGITRNDVTLPTWSSVSCVSADGYRSQRTNRRSLSRSKRSTGWQHILHEELSRLPNLQYVVALGNYALEALIGLTGITDKRVVACSHWTSDGRRVQVLCTYNPAHVMREPRMEIVFRMDLNKLNG